MPEQVYEPSPGVRGSNMTSMLLRKVATRFMSHNSIENSYVHPPTLPMPITTTPACIPSISRTGTSIKPTDV